MKFKLPWNKAHPTPANKRQYFERRRKKALYSRIGIGAVLVLFVSMAVLVSGGAFDNSDGSTGRRSPLTIFSGNSDDNPLKDKQLYVDPNSNAARQAKIWRETQPKNAELMDILADQANSRWYSNAITYDDVHDYVRAANDEDKLPVLVAYYIPDRDCSKYSTGGAPSENDYYDYIETMAQAVGSMDAVIILEPDALVHMQSNDPDGQPCLDDNQREMYIRLFQYAVDRFKSLAATYVYIDAGNSGWETDVDTIANLLKRANIERADGFSLNVSNFRTNEETIKLGNAISDKVGGKHYVIDTSRNGLGPFVNQANINYGWCNPPGRALGHYPTVNTGVDRVDAYLYIKNVGESDGTDPDQTKCFGGPKAGQWWPEYAAGLVERWPKELQYNYRP